MLKPFVKNSFIYVLGDIINKGAGFFLIPLYTRYLTPSEYGTISFLTSFIAVISTILMLGMRSAVWRFYFQFDDIAERKSFYGSIWFGLCFFSGICIAGFMLLGSQLFIRYLSSVPYVPYIVLAMINIWLIVGFQIIPLSLLRIQGKSVSYLFYNLLLLFLNLGLNIWFVIGMKKGLLGVVWGNLLTAIIMSVVSIIIMISNVNLRINFKYLSMALKYGLPLVPHDTAQWALGLSDRIVVERLLGLELLGIYTLGYQFGSVYQAISASINVALVPQYSRAAKDSNVLNNLIRLTTYYVLAIAVIGLGICLWAPDIIKIIAPSSFNGSSAAIVPWAVLGYFFFGLYYIPMNYVSLTLGKTKNIAWITVFAGVINVAGNVIFIPRYGIIVAAIMTFVSYFVLFLGLSLFSLQDPSKFYLKYEYKRILTIIVACVITYFLTKSFLTFRPLVNFAIGLVGIGFFIVLLGVSKFWTTSETRSISKMPSLLKKKVFKGS